MKDKGSLEFLPFRLPSRWFYRLVTTLIRPVMTLLFGLRIDRDPDLKTVRGPLIVLGNHPSYLDPFFVALAFRGLEISFVAASSFFRSRIIARLLHLSGVIPKTQFRSDATALKRMLQVLRNNGILGVFPEGQRSLDGTCQPVDDSVARLIKKIGCPVATVHISGAYLTWPRWSLSGFRPGRVAVRTRLLQTADEVQSLTVEALAARITQALAYDDYQWQKSRHRAAAYWSPAPAKGLHQVCHQCPDCRRLLIMTSSRFHLKCQHCKASFRINFQGFINRAPASGKKVIADLVPGTIHAIADLVPGTVHAWHVWQQQLLAADMARPDFKLEFEVRAFLARRNGPFEESGTGRLFLDRTGFWYVGTDRQGERVTYRSPLRFSGQFSADFGVRIEIAHDDGFWRFYPQQGQAVMLLADALWILNRLDNK